MPKPPSRAPCMPCLLMRCFHSLHHLRARRPHRSAPLQCLRRRFEGLSLVARTTESVAAGEELAISYGPQRAKRPTPQRLRELQVRLVAWP